MYVYRQQPVKKHACNGYLSGHERSCEETSSFARCAKGMVRMAGLILTTAGILAVAPEL